MDTIKNKRQKLREYVDILSENTEENANIIKKYKDIIKYCNIYYDKYSSIYLDNVFQIFIALLKNIRTKNFDIRKFSDYINKKIKSVIDDLKFSPNIEYNELERAIIRINKSINEIKIYLITLQSKETLSNISPVIDEVEIMKMTNIGDTEMLIRNTNNLNEQYEKFISEIEVVTFFK